MKKTAVFFGLCIVVCLVAGAYGALLNRLGAALVGFRATWWMGIVIGVVLIPLGLIITGHKQYWWGMVRTIAVVLSTALVIGLGALLLGDLFYNENNLYFSVPSIIDNTKAFYLSGHMHNFSYLGGLVGIFTGIAWILIERHKAKGNTKQGKRTPLAR